MTRIRKRPFGRTGDGKAVDLYTFANANGAEMDVMTFGGVLVGLRVPDRRGQMDDVVLGFDDLRGYLDDGFYVGAIIGRYANRIARGRFRLGGKEYRLARNDGENHLHGGVDGFHRRLWTARPVDGEEPSLFLTHRSPDGEEGYPGNLDVRAVYTLTRDNAMRLEMEATSDRDTVVNLTHHAYFNLAGGGDVLGHRLRIRADAMTPVDASLIPTGELRGVAGTPFDFRTAKALGERIDEDDEQLRIGHGYDHNWVLGNPDGELVSAARVEEPGSGRVLEVFTTEPGLQLYSGNFLDGRVGKGGRAYARRHGFCLEPQRYPDSPNQPGFPSAVSRAGETYRHTLIYKLDVQRRSAPSFPVPKSS